MLQEKKWSRNICQVWGFMFCLLVFILSTSTDSLLSFWTEEVTGTVSDVGPGKITEIKFVDGSTDGIRDFKPKNSQSYYYPRKGDVISKASYSFVYYINGKASTDSASLLATAFPLCLLFIAFVAYLIVEWILFRREHLPGFCLILSKWLIPDSRQQYVEAVRSWLVKKRLGVLVSLGISIGLLIVVSILGFLISYMVTAKEFVAS